ncbi:MAG: HEPN domain-containing protein [Candidatus Aenigmarchaeota archaeon]|nr:HEPN domain-containing protein [Candidatus Aenigmarchaeota archaeon]
MRKEILNWWKRAEKDLEIAGHCIKSKDYYAAVFFCQQSVEKGLKALIMKKEKQPDIISHSLIYLGKRIKIPETFHSFLRDLTPQRILTRYPDASDELPFELYDKEISI